MAERFGSATDTPASVNPVIQAGAAARFGSSSDAPTSTTSTIGDFASGALSKLNPVNTLRGMADTLEGLYKDPAGTAGNFVKNVLAHPYSAIARGVEAAKAGKAEEAMAHFASAANIGGFATEGSEVKTATPGQRATGFGELLGTGLNAYLTAKAPDIVSGIKDKVSTTKEMVSQVLEHPKVQSAIKDAAIELAKEVPGVKTAIKAGKIASAGKEVFDDIRGAQAVSEIPASTPPALPAQPPPIPAEPPIAAAPAPVVHTLEQEIERARTVGARYYMDPSGDPLVPPGKPGSRYQKVPPLDQTGVPAPVASKAEAIPPGEPPSAYLDQETSGLQVPQIAANRAAKAQRFIDKLGGTQNLPRTQAEWAKVASDIGEKPPSLDTQEQITFGLNKLMRAGTERPGEVETLPPAVAKNPKALKIAQQLLEEMQRSSAPSLPVRVKGKR